MNLLSEGRRVAVVLTLMSALCVVTVPCAADAVAENWDALTFHQKAKPLPSDATTEDWPRFLGLHDNATSGETGVAIDWPESGPPLVWEAARGTGYTSPSIADERLFLFHRLGDHESLDCLDPETGQRLWNFSYPIDYSDRYGFNNGPRASPVIDGDRVYLFGVTAIMHCLDVKSGEVIWKRDLMVDYKIPQYFFGSGPTPIVWKNLLLQNVGGREANGKGVCVAAFDKMTGKEVWRVVDEWGASYASPVVASLRGKDCLLVLAGGESRPAHGGLLCIDAATGTLYSRFPWRADKYESVNASTPLAINDRRVFISECYMIGGVMLEFDEKLQPKPVWKSRDCGMHWMTPVVKNGYLYGFAGRNEPDAFLGCFDLNTGKEVWRDELIWEREFQLQQGARRRTAKTTRKWSFFRGSLLRVQDTFIGLGELGTLARFDLTPKGPGVSHKVELFAARETWSLPVLHRGLLYIPQHGKDMLTGTEARLLCYDLRASQTSDSENSDADGNGNENGERDESVETLFEKEDRVVLLGNTFFEREGNYGHIETQLTAALPEMDLIVRNMGWSGDSVFGHARSFFGPPQEGLDRLKANLDIVKPTVVVFNYGAVAAFEGDKGLEEFVAGYEKLIDMVTESTGARAIVMSPPPCESLGDPLPDMTEQNNRLATYRDAIKGLAKRKGLPFADLFAQLGEGKWQDGGPFTENGVHFTKEGYAAIAPAVVQSLGLNPATLNADQSKALRTAITEKNFLFFNRWRPQNETYLRGFRKHEQGQNARELPMFDPLILEKEKEISALKGELQG